MEYLTEDDIVPGGRNYSSLQPLKPINILFAHNVQLFIFQNGFAIVPTEETNHPRTRSFDELCRPFFHSFANLSKKLHCNSSSFVFYRINIIHGLIVLFAYADNSIFSFSVLNGNVTPIWRVDSNQLLFPKNNNKGELAFSDGENIHLINENGKDSVIYTEKSPYAHIDKTPSRNEWNIDELFYWSPDCKYLAFYRTDDTLVANYPLVKFEGDTSKVNLIKYPMAGGTSELVSVSVLMIDENRESYCDFSTFGDSCRENQQLCENYITALSWSDENQLFFCEMPRHQKSFRVNLFHPSTQQIFTLWEEKNERYVEPQHPFYFIDNCVIFLSNRNGHTHLYKYNLKDNVTLQITDGNWDILELKSVNKKEKDILAYATFSSPCDRNILVVHLDTGKFDVIGEEKHYCTLFPNNVDGNLPIYWEESPNDAGILTICDLQKSNPKLFKFSVVDHYKNKFILPTVITGSFVHNDRELFFHLTLPIDKQPRENKNGKTPLFFYVYGGPHVQLVTNEYGSRTKGIDEIMANNGIATFFIDPRGSSNRGVEFEQAIYQHINAPQIEDYDAALDWLTANHPNIDTTNMVVYGWSFGGFMTLSMLLKSRYNFKMGIAGGAVTDWRFYEVMYTERYMGVRNDVTEPFYELCDIKNSINQLHTPLFLIHCDNDPVVLPIHPISLLAKANQSPDLPTLINTYLFPNHAHNVKGCERVQLSIKIKSLVINALYKKMILSENILSENFVN